MTATTLSILIAIWSLLLAGGIGYAVYIYHNSFEQGWTWLSVVIGDGWTDIGTVAAILTILLSGDPVNPWFVAVQPIISHLLTGGPMIAGQLWKKRAQERRAEKLKDKVENGEQ
jgi:hypothetical protein